MNVCIDIQAAIAQRAGVGRYTQALVEHLDAYVEQDELRLFYFDFKRQGMPLHVRHARAQAVRWFPGRWAQKAWNTLGRPAFDRFAGAADVYHFPNFIRPPLRQGKSLVTIHDVSFLRHPETVESGNLRYLRRHIQHTIAQSDAIITVSEFSAREVHELLGAERDKLFPIHLGLADSLVRADAQSVSATRQALGLDKPYILTVGTLEPRKNLVFLIDLFEKLEGFDGDLVVAGMRGWKYEPILQRMAASPLSDRIKYLEYVPDDRLTALYMGVELFVFPSLYEGFGLPPLEAMACGAPVLSSTAGSLPEVLGSGAEMIHSFDREEWTAAADRLLTDSEYRTALTARGTAWATRFNWDATARKTWEVYRAL